jgi:hypothetical protein
LLSSCSSCCSYKTTFDSSQSFAATLLLHSDWFKLVWLPASAAPAVAAAAAADATTGDSRANAVTATDAAGTVALC